MEQLDQELIDLRTSHDTVKNHIQFKNKCQELKNYLAKLNKYIISKKQSKMTKDRAAFAGGFAYCWHTPKQGRDQKRGPRPANNLIADTNYDTGTESDSILFSSTEIHRNCIATSLSQCFGVM